MSRPHRRRRRGRPVAVALLAAVVFLAGLAIGEALNDNPAPGGTQTRVRTLRPLPLQPAARATVTVTVTRPSP